MSKITNLRRIVQEDEWNAKMKLICHPKNRKMVLSNPSVFNISNSYFYNIFQLKEISNEKR